MVPDANIIDLWPDEITVSTTRPPTALLKEQAMALGRRTKNLVIGIVKTSTISRQGKETLLHAFSIEAPVLGYSRLLFRALHVPEELYPLGVDCPFLQRQEAVVESEEDLAVWLSALFREPKVISLIQALVAQST